MNLLSFPEELLERILEQVVLYPSPSHPRFSPEAPSTNLGPSPISSPATTPKSSPSATRHVSPQTSPTRSRPPSPGIGGARGRSTVKARVEPISGAPRLEDVKPTNTSSSSWTNSTPKASPKGTTTTTPLDLALAPLLTCRLFSRIALPLYYRVVQLRSREQARLFLEDGLGCAAVDREGKMRGRKSRDGRRLRAGWIRRLVICGVWKEAGEVMGVLAGLVPQGHASLESLCGLLLKPIRKFKGKGKARVEEECVDASACGEDTGLSLRVLEITIDAPPLPPPMLLTPGAPDRTPTVAQLDDDAEALAHALRAFAACWTTQDGHRANNGRKIDGQAHPRDQNPLRHIVLRKPQNVYLTHPRSKAVVSALANLVESADNLESAFVAFRISDDAQATQAVGAPGVAGVHPHAFQVQHLSHHPQPSTAGPNSPNHRQHGGPITDLTYALASRPRLKTFVTILPSVWNEAVLRVSLNESLARIVLLGLNGIPVAPPVHASNRYSLQLPSRHAASPLSNVPQSTSLTNIGGTQADNSTQGSPGGSRRPRLSVMLPPNPVERVYAASTRDVNGFHPTNPNSNASAMEPFHGHGHGTNGGYGGGGYVPMGTGLFMNQAKKHERLCDLIRSGAEPPSTCLSPRKDGRGSAPGLEQRCPPAPTPSSPRRSSPFGAFVPASPHGGIGLPPRFDGSGNGYTAHSART